MIRLEIVEAGALGARRIYRVVRGHGGSTCLLQWPTNLRLEWRDAQRDNIHPGCVDESELDICHWRVHRSMEMDLVLSRRPFVDRF